MTDPSRTHRGLRDRLTVVKLRAHLLRFRDQGVLTAPDRAPGDAEDVRPVVAPIAQGRDRHQAAASAASSPSYPSAPAGTALEPGGVYIDLATPGGAPFVALAGQVAGSRNRYVSRRDVAADHWNVLVSGGLGRAPSTVDPPGPEGPALGAWEDEGGALRQGESRHRRTRGGRCP